MKHLILILALLLPGCAAMDSFFNNNKVLSTIFMKHLIIDKIENSADKKAASSLILKRAAQIEAEAANMPDLTRDGAIALFKRVVKYSEMSIQKKSAIDDAITIALQADNVETKEAVDIPVSVKLLLFSARQAANLYQ